MTALREQFGEWEIEIVEGMRVVERIIPIAKTCLVDRTAYLRDPELMLAHVWAHLTLHLSKMGGAFTQTQEDEADDLVDLMLDHPENRDGGFWEMGASRLSDSMPPVQSEAWRSRTPGF